MTAPKLDPKVAQALKKLQTAAVQAKKAVAATAASVKTAERGTDEIERTRTGEGAPMTTKDLKKALEGLIPVGNSAVDELAKIAQELNDALAANKPIDVRVMQRKVSDCHQSAAGLMTALDQAKKHADTYAKDWASKTVKKAVQPKVVQNRKDMGAAINNAEKVALAVFDGLRAADWILEDYQRRRR